MRILFIGHTRIGDAVLSTGILQALAERHPDARFTVACGAVAAPLFTEAPFVERTLPIVKRNHGLHWIEVWRQVASTRWDLIVDLRHSVIPWTVRARRRLVRRRIDEPGEHRVVSLARVLQRDGSPPSPRLWSSRQQQKVATKLIPDGPPVIGLGPTANWRGKIWPAEKFAALTERLAGESVSGPLRGARVAVFAGPDERDIAQPVIDAIAPARCIDLVGAADLPTIFSCLQRCALYVGNDSGLMHMAAAAGVPTVGLFGPSRPEHYAPWGDRTAYVRTRRAYEELVGGRDYDHRTTGSLMTSLEIDDVVAAAASLTGTLEPASAP